MAFTTVNNINDVTIGYSRKGAQEFVNKLRTDLIPAAKTQLRNETNTLESAITPYWGGNAPVKFMKNVRNSAEQVCDLMDTLSESLHELFESLYASWVESDENIVGDSESPF